MNRNTIPTGRAARLLGVTEPRLANLVRRGKIHPEPQVVAGRRHWTEEQVRQAAEHLGHLTPSSAKSISTAFNSEEVARG